MKSDMTLSKGEYLKAVSGFSFTAREKELGYLKPNGFTNKRIAEMYGIAITTVKKHFTHIYEKAWVPGKTEFIKKIK